MKILIGISGASGSVLAKTMIEQLQNRGHCIYVVASETARAVFLLEQGDTLENFLCTQPDVIKQYDNDNLFAPFSSGSFYADVFIIIPCSVGCAARIANSVSNSLITRTADVFIKERRPMMLCVRESPLSSLHLEALLRLSNCGVYIFPVVPNFYSGGDIAKNIVGRALTTLKIENDFYKGWQGI